MRTEAEIDADAEKVRVLVRHMVAESERLLQSDCHPRLILSAAASLMTASATVLGLTYKETCEVLRAGWPSPPKINPRARRRVPKG